MKAVLDELGSLGGKPIETLSPEEARKQPSPADAVKSLMKKQDKKGPEPVGDVENTRVQLGDHKVGVRIYTPKGDGPFPVILYIHGGGWVIADLDTYDSSPRALCNAVNAIVISTEYRHAPEFKFPQPTKMSSASISGQLRMKASAITTPGVSPSSAKAPAAPWRQPLASWPKNATSRCPCIKS